MMFNLHRDIMTVTEQSIVVILMTIVMTYGILVRIKKKHKSSMVEVIKETKEDSEIEIEIVYHLHTQEIFTIIIQILVLPFILL